MVFSRKFNFHTLFEESANRTFKYQHVVKSGSLPICDAIYFMEIGAVLVEILIKVYLESRDFTLQIVLSVLIWSRGLTTL